MGVEVDRDCPCMRIGFLLSEELQISHDNSVHGRISILRKSISQSSSMKVLSHGMDEACECTFAIPSNGQVHEVLTSELA